MKIQSKIPSNNVFAESLPDYGYISIQNVGSNQIFIWHGRNETENAVVSWSGHKAKQSQNKLIQLAQKANRLKSDTVNFIKKFKVSYQK